jgi:hypothetical protein
MAQHFRSWYGMKQLINEVVSYGEVAWHPRFSLWFWKKLGQVLNLIGGTKIGTTPSSIWKVMWELTNWHFNTRCIVKDSWHPPTTNIVGRWCWKRQDCLESTN